MSLPLESSQHSFSDLIRSFGSSQIWRDDSSANDSVHGIVDLSGCVRVTHKLEHEGGRADGGDGVGYRGYEVGNVGGGTVNGFSYKCRFEPYQSSVQTRMIRAR